MTKQQFIDTLNRRLQIINEKERKDIIDEYCNHIDMRMAEGKTEEEAIDDFGDIDELIDDILDAYKIDSKKMKNDSFEGKANQFLDEMFEGLKRFVSHLTSLDMDGVVHLMFELFIVLIILAVLRWPFEAIASMGSSLLDSVFGFGIGSVFGGLWHALIMLLFLALSIIVLINIVTRRVRHYRQRDDNKSVMDDLKSSFSFEEAKDNINSMNNRTQSGSKSNQTPYEDPEANQENQGQPYDRHSDRTQYHYRSDSATPIIFIIMKIFTVLFVIPFFGAMIGLCILLAIMVVFSIQGFSLVGAYMIVIGLIVGIGAVIDIICHFISKGGN